MVKAQHRVLIVGTGSIGERHLRCFLATGRAQVSFCEIDPDLRQVISGRYGVHRTFASLDQALEQKPEAAVICTPAHLHVRMALALARTGAHLLIEKPLSTGLEGIEELENLCEQKGLNVAVAYVWREHPALAAMKKAMDSGRFGRPVEVVAVGGQHFPTYRPAYRRTYYTDHATGGGAIQDAMTHLLNAGEWLAGPIQRLVCDAEHHILEGVTVEDTVHVLTRQGRVSGSYCYNQYQAPNELNLTVIGDQGTARLESQHVRWGWMNRPDTPWEHEAFGPLERDTLFVQQAHRFLDTVEGRGEARCGLVEGIQTLKANLAALASVKHRRWEEIPVQSGNPKT